jgi:hypothetical protein
MSISTQFTQFTQGLKFQPSPQLKSDRQVKEMKDYQTFIDYLCKKEILDERKRKIKSILV